MWLVPFLLGRPGNEYGFEVNPSAMDITPTVIAVRQRNLAGDLKKSVLKADAPTIKFNSSYLTLPQRNQFASLLGVQDTFLSFITRDDWQVVNELVTVIDVNHIQIANSSATRLSAALAQLGLASIITIQKPFTTVLGAGWGAGPYGGGVWGGGGGNFDPGTVTYADATRIVTMQNALPSTNVSLYVSYTYTGWLVDMEAMSHKAQGGWVDRFTYDITLTGA